MAQTTSFTTPGYDYGVDVGKIERRRALADVLQKQSMQPIEQQTAGGWVVPTSPTEGLTKLAQAFASRRQQSKADEKQKALNSTIQGDYQNMLAKGLSQLQGTPARTIQPDPQEAQQSADQGTPQVGTVNQPAQSPNPMAALQTFGSHPMGQQFAPLAMQEMQRQRLAEALRGGAGSPQAQQPNPMQGGLGASVMAPGGQPGGMPPSAPQPQGANTSGPAGGIPMEAWLQQDPSGKTYLEQLAKDYSEGQKPVVNRGFGLGRMVNGRYVPDQASLDQALTMERGKTAFGVHNVQGAGGGTVPTFGYQLPGYGGLPGAGQQPSPVSAPRPSPASPVSVPTAAPQTQPAPAGDPWATMPKRAEPQGMGESTYHRATATNMAEFAHKMSEKYGGVAQTANERKSFNDQALEQLQSATTGPGSLTITGVQNFLNSRFGIPLDQLQKANAGDAAATQELNKNLLNAATKTAKANYGSRMTQSEVMMQIKQGSPNVDMTRAAISYLLKADNARADYEMKQAGDVGKYLSSGGDPYQFEGWYAKAFPMSGAIHGAGSGGSSGSQPMFAVNQSTKERIVSTDGGQTWKPAQ